MVELQILAVLSSDAVGTDSPYLDLDVAADVDDLLALPEAVGVTVDGILPPMMRVVVASKRSLLMSKALVALSDVAVVVVRRSMSNPYSGSVLRPRLLSVAALAARPSSATQLA